MSEFHAIGGLPRSGSTLLCNILNQNPRFHASSTSVLPQTLSGMAHLWSNSPEIKSRLIDDKQATEDCLGHVMRAVITEWHASLRGVVFDKSRAWNHNAALLEYLVPSAKLILCVRDLRAVFASIEKQHGKNPIFDLATVPLEKTHLTRADSMFSAQGMIGGPLVGVEDVLRRRSQNVHVVQYEQLVAQPRKVLSTLYTEIGEDDFDHDFDNVKNAATDCDALYLDKFPHQGDGKVEERKEDWQEHVSPDVCAQIMNRFPKYNRAFGYV